MRKSKGLTQQELSKILGVASSTISMYENGKREPDYKNLKKLAYYFDCSVDYLLGNTPFGRYFVFDENFSDADSVPLKTEKPSADHSEELPYSDMELLSAYKNADSVTQELIRRALGLQ